MAKQTRINPEKEKKDQSQICDLPLVPDRKLEDHIDPNRASLIRYMEKKWVNYTVLHYHFLENGNRRGPENQKQAVRDAFKTWKDLGIGLEFRESDDPSDAEIRITFNPGGSWSYVGRDSIDLVTDPAQPTMNFGWNLTTSYGRDTALHEIGHAMGFPHEHQNPNAGIVWDEEKVYRHFASPPNNWDRNKTYYNIIRKISSSAVGGSDWDKDSIMHYQFEKGLIISPSEYQIKPLIPDAGLSEVDKKEALKFYPSPDKATHKELKPYLSQIIDIEPGEQLDYIIEPPATRKYHIQTFGRLDTVIVLFEDANGELLYIDGDDDSGYDYNSKISTRLVKGKKYFLRLRLYFSNESGRGAVMLW